MNKLNVAIAYHASDIHLVQQLLGWIFTLNGNNQLPNHLVLLGDSGLTKDQRMEIKQLGLQCFSSVNSLPVPVERPGWPTGPNAMFRMGMKFVQEFLRGPFLWLEPDAIPTRQGWLEALEEDYFRQPYRFYGTLSVRGENNSPEIPDSWMAGVGIYPNDAFSELAAFCDSKKPFDVAAAASTTPRLFKTDMIVQNWGTRDTPPTFVSGKKRSPNQFHVSDLGPNTMIFHRNKDGSLIRVLSGESSLTETDEAPPAPPTAPADNAKMAAPAAQAPQVPRPPVPRPPAAGTVVRPVAADLNTGQFGGGAARVMKTSETPAMITPQD